MSEGGGMADFLNQGWLTLQLVWDKIKYGADDHIVLPVLLGTIIIILLLRIFLMPSVSRGN
jgi:hypothetical protein